MNKKIAIGVTLMTIGTFCLTSCGKSQAIDHLKSHLKDPDSLKIMKEEHKKTDAYDIYRFKWDAKNSFGGYTGAETSYVGYDYAREEWICTHCGGSILAIAWSVDDFANK